MTARSPSVFTFTSLDYYPYRPQGEDDGDREHQKDNRHHHQNFLAGAGLDQRSSAGLSDVGGLRMQDAGQRRTALDRNGHALREAGDDRKPGTTGEPVEGGADRASRPDVGEHRTEVGRELAT